MAARERKKWKRPGERNVIWIFSGHRLVMEGVERIIFCNEERIELKGAQYLCVSGKDMHLEELGNAVLAVCGEMETISFREKTE